MEFLTVKPEFEHVPNDGSVYADIANHCKRWDYYKVAGSQTSSAHECCHGVNADLRNQKLQIRCLGEEHWETTNRIYSPEGDEYGAGGFNCFYCLEDRYVKIEEPNCKKSDSIPYIPEAFRFSRFKTYIEGQREWDNQPLYIFDEWSAYCAGAACAIKDNCGAPGSDIIFGPVEFIAYGTAMLVAVKAKTGSINNQLAQFTKWMIDRSFDLYEKGRDRYGWEEAEKCYQMLKVGAEGDAIREFWARELSAEIDFDV